MKKIAYVGCLGVIALLTTEFGSFGTSFINLGITVGTAVGGWAISAYGIENTLG